MHTGSSGSAGLSKGKRATGSRNKTQHDSRWEFPVFSPLPTSLPLSPWLFRGCPTQPGRALSEPRSSSRELSSCRFAGRSLLSSWRLRGGNLAGAPSQQSPICSKRTLGGSLSRREGCATFAVKLHGWPQRHWLRISKEIVIFEKPSQEENTRKASDAGDLGVRKAAELWAGAGRAPGASGRAPRGIAPRRQRGRKGAARDCEELRTPAVPQRSDSASNVPCRSPEPSTGQRCPQLHEIGEKREGRGRRRWVDASGSPSRPFSLQRLRTPHGRAAPVLAEAGMEGEKLEEPGGFGKRL
ncbi:uncharacterized protein LOC125693482 isoform X1 [Lagopus muta]|uniref:uncharacterized protein LOC125693482 isoform X1 n=1 Tax=Lagopus muta TaxID=64668 RepID=UPI0020A04282|nr:uncharacterized protein LOC125693482 isoform X1 [Lagopus muta]